MRGRKHTAEARQKMSEAAKRRSISPETRKKMSESLKGRKHSPETRRKMSEARKKYWRNSKSIANPKQLFLQR